jgi:hypothetical protein
VKRTTFGIHVAFLCTKEIRVRSIMKYREVNRMGNAYRKEYSGLPRVTSSAVTNTSGIGTLAEFKAEVA